MQMHDAGLERRGGIDGRERLAHPLQASVTAMRMSWQPRAFRSVKTFIQNLAPFGLLDPQTEDVAVPIGQHRQRQIDRFAAHDAFVAHLDAERIEEDDRIDAIERTPPATR